MEESNTTHWSVEETKFFICMWRQDELMRQCSKPGANRKRGEKIYREMSASMAASGYYRSHTQIKNKMRWLTSTYNDVNSSNKRSGRNRGTCPFYDELHQFLGGRPALNPPPGLVLESSTRHACSDLKSRLASAAVVRIAHAFTRLSSSGSGRER